MTREKNRDAGWAVFNIDADGNQFDFKVALGGTTTSFRDPDSTRLVLNDVTDTKICRISIQRPTRTRRGTDAKRLEVISPLHGNDELDLAAVCVQQLSTALRLYSPVPFSIVRRERPRVSGLRPQSTERYILKGSQLRIFRSFSQRLLDFHVSRNLFRLNRVLPEGLEDDVRTLLGGSRELEAHVLKTEPHVMIAADLFEKTFEGQSIAPELQLVLLMMAAEALFGTDDKSELAFRLSLRLAVLNGSSDAHRKELFEAVRSYYDTRSRLVHGSWYRGAKGFVRVSESELRVLRNLVRASILYFLASKGLSKEQLLQTLDRGVFDRREIDELRVSANHYWGLEGVAEERIHAAKW